MHFVSDPADDDMASKPASELLKTAVLRDKTHTYKGGMLPIDDLAEVASALARTDLDTLLVTDRRHNTLIQSYFDGKGPLRFVNFARSLNKELKISGFNGEHTLSDIQQFYRSLRNCYVSSLRLHRQVIHPRELADLRAIRNDYAVNQAHLSSRDANGTMHLLEAIPRCTALKWEHALTDDFFSRASIRYVRYLNLVNCKNLDLNAVQEWLHSTRENVGGRRLTILRDQYDFDATELARMLRNEFLGDTQSREYQLIVYGNRVSLRFVRDETVANAAGDFFAVEAADHRAFWGGEFCVTRLSKYNAGRTSIVASTDGSKVWDFGTTHDLDRNLISNGITELLARSGLIANEMTCSCRVPMQFRLRAPVRCDTNAPSNKSINDYVWKCSGENKCKFRINDGSPMKVLSWLGDILLILKAVILVCTGKTDDEIHAALRLKVDDVARLRDIYARITRLCGRDEEHEVRCRLKKFYENMKLEKYHQRMGCHATFVVLEE